MSDLYEQVEYYLKTNIFTLIHWSSLLDFIDKHKNRLSLEEATRLFQKSEFYRQYWNTDTSQTRIVEKNGKKFKVDYIRRSLQINLDNLQPNIELILEDKTYEYFIRDSKTGSIPEDQISNSHSIAPIERVELGESVPARL